MEINVFSLATSLLSIYYIFFYICKHYSPFTDDGIEAEIQQFSREVTKVER